MKVLLGVATPFAPPLAIHVMHIVGMCAKKQMIGIAARWIVAFVEGIQSFRDWAVSYLVGDAMRKQIFAIGMNVAVAIAPYLSCPNPASSEQDGMDRAICVNLPLKARRESERRIVSKDEANREALDDTIPCVRAVCDRGRLSAPTQTKPAWIRRIHLDRLGFSIVPDDETHGFALDVSIAPTGFLGYWRGLSTAAFTEFCRELGRGMILHVVSPFLTINQSRGRFQRRSAISIGEFHYSTDGLLPQGDAA